MKYEKDLTFNYEYKETQEDVIIMGFPRTLETTKN